MGMAADEVGDHELATETGCSSAFPRTKRSCEVHWQPRYFPQSSAFPRTKRSCEVHWQPRYFPQTYPSVRYSLVSMTIKLLIKGSPYRRTSFNYELRVRVEHTKLERNHVLRIMYTHIHVCNKGFIKYIVSLQNPKTQ